MAIAVSVSDVGLDHVIIQAMGVDKLSTAKAAKDLRNGPVTVFKLELNNTIFTSGDKVYVKLYDNISSGWTAGVSPPVIVMPVPVETSGDGNPATGIAILLCPDGMKFENGLSILASKEPGDTITLAPATAVGVRMLTD